MLTAAASLADSTQPLMRGETPVTREQALENALKAVMGDLKKWAGCVARSRGAHSQEYAAVCNRIAAARDALTQTTC